MVCKQTIAGQRTMARNLSPRRCVLGLGPPLGSIAVQCACRATVGAKTAFIAPGSPWENGYCESFNARFRPSHGLHANRCRATDELLNGEVFYTLREAQILIQRGHHHHNTVRPHSALGYRPPAPDSMMPIDQREAHHALTFKLDHPMGTLQRHAS
jgi:transposase InsO family protein